MTPSSGFSYPPQATLDLPLPYSSGSIPIAYKTIAWDSLAERDLSLSDEQQLDLIIQAGLAAQAIFFAALTHDPIQHELELFFIDFVVRCVTTGER